MTTKGKPADDGPVIDAEIPDPETVLVQVLQMLNCLDHDDQSRVVLAAAVWFNIDMTPAAGLAEVLGPPR